VVEAAWEPRTDYELSPYEEKNRLAFNSNAVWRHPSMELKEVAKPAPSPGQVLIRVRRCGICGSDSHFFQTDDDGYMIYSGPARFPCVIGHEFSGTVEELGAGVTGFSKGDMVTAEGMMWCGECHACRAGLLNHCVRMEMVGFAVDGADAEYVVVDSKYCWKIDELKEVYGDEEKAFVAGALIEPISVAYNGIFPAAGGIEPGSYVVVYGTGSIGLAAVALAKAAGASVVIGFDISGERLELARALGAQYVFNPKQLLEKGSSPHKEVMKITKGFGANFQVEAAGAPATSLPEMEKCMSLEGKIVYLGRSPEKTLFFFDTLVSKRGKIYGSRGHSGHRIFREVIRMISMREIDMLPIVTARFPLADAVKAIERSKTQRDGKIMICM